LVTKNINDLESFQNNLGMDFIYICSNLEEAQFFILNNLCNSNSDDINQDITIYIREGTYFQDKILWRTTSPNHRLTIRAFLNEKVIFDGKKTDGTLVQNFLELSNKNGRTNLWIEGLIIQNYANGIWLGNTL